MRGEKREWLGGWEYDQRRNCRRWRNKKNGNEENGRNGTTGKNEKTK